MWIISKLYRNLLKRQFKIVWYWPQVSVSGFICGTLPDFKPYLVITILRLSNSSWCSIKSENEYQWANSYIALMRKSRTTNVIFSGNLPLLCSGNGIQVHPSEMWGRGVYPRCPKEAKANRNSRDKHRDRFIVITEGDAHYLNRTYAIFGCTVNLYNHQEQICLTSNEYKLSTQETLLWSVKVETTSDRFHF